MARRAFLVFLAFAACAVQSQASIVPFTFGNTWGCLGFSVPNSAVLACSIGGQNQNVLSGEADVNATYGSLAANQATMTIAASGNGGYGDLHAGASASFDITGSPTTAFVRGGAGFVDEITISFAPRNGQAGLLYLNYALAGTISSTGNGHAFTDVVVQAGPSLFPAAQSWIQTYTASTSGFFSLPAPINFVYGQPFGLSFDLETFAGTATPNSNGMFNRGIASGVGTGSAQFLNTLVLTGLTPTDLNGNLAGGAQFASASGTRYSTEGVAPEPSTVLLSLLGIGAITIIRARRETRRFIQGGPCRSSQQKPPYGGGAVGQRV